MKVQGKGCLLIFSPPLAGVMSANTERMNDDIRNIFTHTNNTPRWNLTLPDQNISFSEGFANISEDLTLQNFTTKELSEEGDEFKVVRLEEVSDLLGIELYLSLSTASLAVTFCLVVCIFFVIFCLQETFDGDFLGGEFALLLQHIRFSFRFVLCLPDHLLLCVVLDAPHLQAGLAPAVVWRSWCIFPLVLSPHGCLSSDCPHSSIHFSPGIQS